MKKLILCCLIIGMTMPISAQSNGDADSHIQPETFEMEWADSTITMQQYFVVFLKSGPKRSQSEEEAAKIQEQHLAHLARVYQEGHTSITGPFGDDGEIRGIVVYNTATLEQAKELAEQDPAVKAGRLVVEVHPWWAAKGSKLK